jgi:hypothetical protein
LLKRPETLKIQLPILGMLLAAGSLQAADSMTAINIVLEPDAVMSQRAKALNAQLLKAYPAGFRLDDTHQPHISLLQRYVRTSDLESLYAAIENVINQEQPTQWTLIAKTLSDSSWGELAMATMDIEKTPDLARLQQKLIDATQPYLGTTGSAAAFVTTRDEPQIDQKTLDYVNSFVPKQSGTKFKPHLTVGVAPKEVVQKLMQQPIEPESFRSTRVSVYQLGNFGTARKRLRSFLGK